MPPERKKEEWLGENVVSAHEATGHGFSLSMCHVLVNGSGQQWLTVIFETGLEALWRGTCAMQAGWPDSCLVVYVSVLPGMALPHYVLPSPTFFILLSQSKRQGVIARRQARGQRDDMKRQAAGGRHRDHPGDVAAGRLEGEELT